MGRKTITVLIEEINARLDAMETKQAERKELLEFPTSEKEQKRY